jgi:tetratricopeptide (TPR) repeat protein
LNDIFALQDEITMKIIHSVGMKLVDGEKYAEELLPPSGSLEVFMKTLKAREYLFRLNKEDNILARQAAEEALALDPEYATLYSLVAMTHLLDLYYQSTESPEISFAQANRNIKKALALDSNSCTAHTVLASLYLLRKEYDKAVAAAERAITLNPNAADAYSELGFVLTVSGRAEEGLKILEKSERLNPIPPAEHLNQLGYAYRSLGRYEEAIEVHEKVLKRSPNNVFAHIWLTAAYSASGRQEEARHQAQELIRLDPTFSLDQFSEILPLKDKAEAERLVDDLRKAGLRGAQ